MLNAGLVNGGGYYFLPVAKIAIFCVFTRKSAVQKVG
jgi:hypothetical protein